LEEDESVQGWLYGVEWAKDCLYLSLSNISQVKPRLARWRQQGRPDEEAERISDEFVAPEYDGKYLSKLVWAEGG
jgi:hypothetical protein